MTKGPVMVICTRPWATNALRQQPAFGMPAPAFGHDYVVVATERTAAVKPFATVTVPSSASPPG
jgi:uncharacterized protein (DUF302 family)